MQTKILRAARRVRWRPWPRTVRRCGHADVRVEGEAGDRAGLNRGAQELALQIVARRVVGGEERDADRVADRP